MLDQIPLFGDLLDISSEPSYNMSVETLDKIVLFVGFGFGLQHHLVEIKALLSHNRNDGPHFFFVGFCCKVMCKCSKFM